MTNDRGTGLLFLPALALVLLAAHFVHAGLWPVAAACLACIGLLWARRPWAARVLQSVLVIGAIEWILTAVALAHMRVTHGQSYVRLLVILGAVAAFTLLAAFVFQKAPLQRRFGLDRNGEPPSPSSG